jgi:DNA-binding transcriptional LysR family regulator
LGTCAARDLAHDDAPPGRGHSRCDGYGHDRRRRQTAQCVGARDQPPGQIHREVARHQILPAPKWALFPDPEAQSIFEQINGVYKKVDDLTEIISKIGRGALSELRIGSVPSISQIMVPRAIERVRRRYPDLGIDINILKIEGAIDYLMLGKGDCVAMSYRLGHSGLDFMPLASGELFCIVPQGHELSGRKQVSAAEMIRYPLIGIDPNDPYGRIMAEIFARNKLDCDITIRARFGTTFCALVKAGLGIAIIDQFTVAHGGYPGVDLLRITEPTRFDTYMAVKRGASLSLHVEHFIECLRSEMRAIEPSRNSPGAPLSRIRKK